MALGLVTAGESHGPALVAIVDRAARRAPARQGGDRRRPAPAAAGIRPQPAPEARVGRGRGALRPPARAHARHAAHARRPQPRPRELDVGDEPVAARGRALGQGHEARDAAAAGPRRPRGRPQVRPRRRPQRARACLARATPRRTSRPARSRRRCSRELGIEVAGRPGRDRRRDDGDDGMREATDAARKDRDTLGGIVEVVATGVPPGLGSYAEKGDRLDARLAFALMGIQAVKGVEIGDGFELARRRGIGGARRDRPGPRAAGRTAPAGSRRASRTASRSSSAPR